MIHFTIFLLDFLPSYIAQKKYKELSGENNWIAGFEGVQVHGKNRPATTSLSDFTPQFSDFHVAFFVAGQPTKNKGLIRPY